MKTNLFDLNTDILSIIGDYVKKDNHDRMQKICKRHVKLYEELDTNQESERSKKLEKGVERKEQHKRFNETLNHFEKLEELIETNVMTVVNNLMIIFVNQNLF
jgi:hypothetical protein